MTNTPPIMRYFESAHLPPHLAAVSGSVRELAEYMLDHTDPGPEQTTGLRKLLEAKDAFVRAALDRAPEMAQERSRVSTTGHETAGPPEAPQAPLRAPQQYRCDECGRIDLPTFPKTGGGSICSPCITRSESS